MFRPVGADSDRRVDVRIMMASNVSLQRLVEKGHFLSDLYARIQAFRVELPPLRERRADIPLLVERHLEHFARRVGRDQIPGVSDSLMAALCAADWPANIRQLITVVQRLLIESDGARELTLDHCPDDLAFLRTHSEKPLTNARIHEAIRSENGVSGAARLLGVDRRTIQRRLRGAAEKLAEDHGRVA